GVCGDAAALDGRDVDDAAAARAGPAGAAVVGVAGGRPARCPAFPAAGRVDLVRLPAVPRAARPAARAARRPPVGRPGPAAPPARRGAALPLPALPGGRGGGGGLVSPGFPRGGRARRYRPWTAILLTSFLFALFQVNVFQAPAHLVLGVVLGYLTLRTGSVGPAVLLHFVDNALVYHVLLLGPRVYPEGFGRIVGPDGGLTGGAVAAGLASAALAAAVLLGVPILTRRAGSRTDVAPAAAPVPVKEGPWPSAALV